MGIMGASNGKSETMRTQLGLRAMLHATGSYCLHSPEIVVPFAQQYFSQTGEVVDAELREKLRVLLTALKKWARVPDKRAPYALCD